ncbi:MAG: hypothetical protein CMB06_02635 [Euryarchaeota archaeon]|nr:hypothetical protein [Euryarchaeota archaeon]
MRYVMVTGPMGAGKSTFMRSLPKPWEDFVVPENVPDMLLDHSCKLNNLMFYEIDAPTATGKVWIDWLKAADLQIVVGNGKEKPDKNFIELWDYLVQNCPNAKRIIILNRVNKISKEWNRYSKENILCIDGGKIINEEIAIASEKDILAILNYIEEEHG